MVFEIIDFYCGAGGFSSVATIRMPKRRRGRCLPALGKGALLAGAGDAPSRAVVTTSRANQRPATTAQLHPPRDPRHPPSTQAPLAASPPSATVRRSHRSIEGLQKAAIQTGTESRLRQARDRYKQQGETLARELEKERSKGHNALPPDVAKQRRELFSNP